MTLLIAHRVRFGTNHDFFEFAPGAQVEEALQFAPDFFFHGSAQQLLGIALNGDESIVFTIDGGSAIVYATWTDNITQDPALQYGVVE